MKQELKDKWVKALRSGRYKQATGTLSRTNSYGVETNCCLGVLCRVDRITKKRECFGTNVFSFNGKIYEVDLSDGEDKLLNHFGLSREIQESLIALNDGDVYNNEERQPFPVIADWIEKNVSVTDGKTESTP